jgi:endonuclease/exonuclease/phosphatase family metal-dependent hydrolase
VIRACSPDVVVLQEATDPAVVKRVSDLTELPHWGSRTGHSTGFLSRLPSRITRGTARKALGTRSSRSSWRDGARIFGLHLSAWFSKWSERRRAREIRLLLNGIREHQHGFHVIAGTSTRSRRASG